MPLCNTKCKVRRDVIFSGPRSTEKVVNQFTMVFKNEVSYPIDIYWINNSGEEQRYFEKLGAGNEVEQITYFTHRWIFRKSVTDNKELIASANGVEGKFFEGKKFGAKEGSTLVVRVIEKGTFLIMYIILFIKTGNGLEIC